METFEGIDHLRAMQILVSRRFCSNFDETMKGVLCAYNDILRAKRDVQHAIGSNGTSQTGWRLQNSGYKPPNNQVGIKRGRRRDSDDVSETGGGNLGEHV